MANDPILRLLGLAKKAGKLEVGEEPVGAACRARHARLVLLAGDAAPNTCRRAAHFGEAGNVLWLQLPHSKEELGLILGRKSCAMLAVTDFGLAAALGEQLVKQSPERYGPAAEQLRVKADRALQRQKEKRQHEKNLQKGKKKPWVAPPKETPQAADQKENSRPPRGAEGIRGGTGAHPLETSRPPRRAEGTRDRNDKPPQNYRPPRNKRAEDRRGAGHTRPTGPGGRKLTAKPASGGRKLTAKSAPGGKKPTGPKNP